MNFNIRLPPPPSLSEKLLSLARNNTEMPILSPVTDLLESAIGREWP